MTLKQIGEKLDLFPGRATSLRGGTSGVGRASANITMLVAVLVALGWWDRGRARGGLWVGLAAAVKLSAWPTLVWLAATRRRRALGVAAAVQSFGLPLALPYVSLADFARYEREADRVFSDEAITLSALLHDVGASDARALAVAAGLALVWWGRRDLGLYVVAVGWLWSAGAIRGRSTLVVLATSREVG